MINKRIKSSKGITIVSLVATIIILLILSGTAIYTIRTSNNVGPYNKMVADIKLLEDKILLYYKNYEDIPIKGSPRTVDNKTYYEIDLSKLGAITLNFGNNVDEDDKYYVDNNLKVYYLKGIDKNGVVVHTVEDEEYEEPINEYGFYFNKEYICRNYNYYRANDYAIIVLYEDGSSTTTVYEEVGWREETSHELTDMTGVTYYTINSLIYYQEYQGTGTFGESYTGVVDNNGNLTTTVEFPSGSITYSENAVLIGGYIPGTFSNNGEDLSFGGKTYILNDN